MKFTPQKWLKHSHLQTILPWFLRKKLKVKYQKERLELPDSDFLDLFFTQNYEHTNIILALPGLEGCHNSHYLKGLNLYFNNKKNYTFMVLNHRGCGVQTNRLLASYHGGKTEDINFVVNYLTKKNIKNLFVVGFSFGANIVLKWLGEIGANKKITSAIAVSPVFKLHPTCLWLKNKAPKIYNSYYLKLLSKTLTAKNQQQAVPHFKKLEKIKDLMKYDDTYTAPLNHFKNAEDYYQKASCYPFLKKIKVPTLILHSKDDPIIPDTTIPQKEDLSNAITLNLQNNGGHLGFIYWRKGFRYWIEEKIDNFITNF